MLFFIFFIELCLILYHFKYSFAFLSLKSAAKSIRVLFGNNKLDSFCASPLGKAVKITSMICKYSFLNLLIFGRFIFFRGHLLIKFI